MPVFRSLLRTEWLLVILFAILFAVLLPGRMAVPTEVLFADDASEYDRIARAFLDGTVIPTDREPGYPLFLSLAYFIGGEGSRIAIFVLQALLHVGASVVFARSLSAITSRRASLFALGFLLLFPEVFHLIFTVYREGVAMDLVLLFCASFMHLSRSHSARWLTVAAFAIALLGLTYFPLVPPLALLLIVTAFVRALSWKQVVLLGCGLLVPLGAWMAALSQTDVQCLVPGCERSGLAWHVRGQQVLSLSFLDPPRCLFVEYVTRDLDSIPRSCQFWKEVQYLSDEQIPVDVAGDTGKELVLQYPLLHIWTSMWWFVEYHFPYFNGWGMKYNALAALSTLILLVGCFLSIRTRWTREMWLLAGFALAAALFFAVINVEPRYRMPMLGVYVLFASVGYSSLLERWQRKQA